MELSIKLKTLPLKPGVYIFKDQAGRILYVGKAKRLRARVLSYFRAQASLEPAKQRMVRKVKDLDTITCDNETEALVLEANLIRRHQPPYNVVLRDDKFYLFIKITTMENEPRVFPVRQIKKDGGRYFGPYSSAASVRHTLKLLRRIFPYRSEKDEPRDQIFPHPLFERPPKDVPAHQMPKVENEGLTPATYEENISHIISFLQGNRQGIINTLKAGMKSAAKMKHYERAAIFRDQLRAIERLEGFQKVYLPRRESFDVISIAWQQNRSAANIFSVRQGKLLNKNTFLLRHRSTATEQDILRQFILQYFQIAQDIPPVILTPHHLSDQEAIGLWINQNNPPNFLQPKRGIRRQLLEMGELNAHQLLEQEAAAFASEKTGQALQELARALKIEGIKRLERIEIYDISNIQGKYATGSMAVFTNGQPDKSNYRKFKIQLGDTPNDFAMLEEILGRRFSGRHENWKQPDLILIDGGRGQLNVAQRVMKNNKLSVPIAAIAKREEELYIPSQRQTIKLAYDSPALFLVQRMRDEAHRFTVSYHRTLRQKQLRRSLLDEVPGIGPKIKKRLITHFGSLKTIRQASDEDLIKLVGRSKTNLLRDWL